jgi:DNA polymerase
MSDRRSAVFLEEMGVGPQWRLRNRPASANPTDAADAAFVDAHGAEPADQAAYAHAPLAQAEAAVPHAAPVTLQSAPATASADNGMQRAPAGAESPAAAARAASATPGAAADARQTPPAATGTPAAPVAPARVPGTPSIASTGEDMSWFDDAPTPEYKPQRKKVAAPEQPAEAAPQRPAAAAPAPAARQPMPPRAGGTPPRAGTMQPPAASAPPSAMGYDAPAYDDIPMDEPPAWFDDDQPAAPARAPAPTRSSESAPQAGNEQIAEMDWPALQAAVASCTRCGRCATRQQAIPGRGDEGAGWIALDTAPGQVEDAEGYQFAGDPGYLLDNMLKAVGQSTQKGAYLTSLVKCYAPHAPSAEELQACRRPKSSSPSATAPAKACWAPPHAAASCCTAACRSSPPTTRPTC